MSVCGKSLPLKEEREAGGLGEGVGKAVTEIQSGGVMTLTEFAEGLPGDMGLFGVEWDNLDSGGGYEKGPDRGAPHSRGRCRLRWTPR